MAKYYPGGTYPKSQRYHTVNSTSAQTTAPTFKPTAAAPKSYRKRMDQRMAQRRREMGYQELGSTWNS